MEKVGFILGAGAHAPFKFPSGKTLKEEVAEDLNSDRGPGDVGLAARKALRNCGVSIDRFLANNPNFNDLVRPRIARVLLRYESRAVDGQMDDWLEHVWQIMPNKRGGLNDNFVFITFNYDRLLEYRLAQGCMGYWGMDFQTACNQLDCLNIYHVYGSFGDIAPNSKSYYEFGSQKDYESAGKRLKIIGETDHEPTKDVHKRLAECKRIFILGCYYHPENMKLLSLDALPQLDGRKLVGTSFERTGEEQETLRRQYKSIEFVSTTYDAFALLRNSRHFQEVLEQASAV